MEQSSRFLFKNGVVVPSSATPSVAAFLEAHPGAYTTTRTHKTGSEILFLERHMHRLSNSFNLLLKESPKLLVENAENFALFSRLSDRAMMWDSVIRCLVNDSLRKAVPFFWNVMGFGEECAITVLLSGNSENLRKLEGGFDEGKISELLDVYLHIGGYGPRFFGVKGTAAHLAVVGRGRDFANAKYSDWVRLRKNLEILRPPSVTELLLSNDGEHILEGCLTNLFVVCIKENDGECNTVEQNELRSLSAIEVQTAPLNDGVLPGVIRDVIKDICLKIGIPFREVAPSWSKRDFWVEAFITSSLRIIQDVGTIQAPSSWKLIESNTWDEVKWVEEISKDRPGRITSFFKVINKSNTWKEVKWVEKRFEDGPGRITSLLQKEILKRAGAEAFPVASLKEQGPPM